MAKNKIPKISKKVLIIYFFVLIIEVLLFISPAIFIGLKINEDITYDKIDDFLFFVQATDNVDSEKLSLFDENIYYVILDDNNSITHKDDRLVKKIKSSYLEKIVNDSSKEGQSYKLKTDNGYVFYKVTKTSDNDTVIGISLGEKTKDNLYIYIFVVLIAFLFTFFVGAILLCIYIRSLVYRIIAIKDYVETLPLNNYKFSYVDTKSNDEIADLSKKIDVLRDTIVKNEDAKETMLQNVSHDLKTPIAVIRSYAEAIGDGVEDIEATHIIISQANKLEKKVKRFIDFNKLEYLGEDTGFVPVAMKPIIETIISNCKYLTTKIDFVCDLDDTEFIGRYENYFTVCENLIENSIRYAKQIIKVTLKNGVLTIYNDGKHLDEVFIKDGFKPYEKGSEGKFGLGMSIVCRILEIFQMKLTPKNEEVGVSFTIERKN